MLGRGTIRIMLIPRVRGLVVRIRWLCLRGRIGPSCVILHLHWRSLGLNLRLSLLLPLPLRTRHRRLRRRHRCPCPPNPPVLCHFSCCCELWLAALLRDLPLVLLLREVPRSCRDT